jgi:ribosome biogenesis GTPase / thiamine phosphate phosphatase
MSAALQQGLVISAHGRHCVVEASSGERTLCHPRGKKSQAVVGDRVQWQATGDEGIIEQLLPRRNLLYRQDELRTKSFAANLDLVLMCIAAEPEFSEQQLTRALIAARAEGIEVLIVLNKQDVQPAFDRAWNKLEPYRRMGETVLATSLKQPSLSITSLAQLQTRLQGRSTLVLGPSGAGKSTLINLLVPHAQAQTAEISRALQSGKHTTTSTTWYWCDDSRQTAVIDSPGFQEFGLHHIEATALAGLMPDLAPYVGQCRFYNCTHMHEPGCAVQTQVDSTIAPQRYKLYQTLFTELSAPPRY